MIGFQLKLEFVFGLGITCEQKQDIAWLSWKTVCKIVQNVLRAWQFTLRYGVCGWTWI